MRRTLITTLVTAVCAVPLQADLSYTMRIEVRKAGEATLTNPALAGLGEALMQALASSGSSESTFAMSDAGTARIEFAEETAAVPKGAVLLRRSDGTRVVLDPAERTYWMLPAVRVGSERSVVPDVSVQRTGEVETIAGVRAERVAYTVRLAGAQGQLPPELAAVMVLDGEMWIASAVKTPEAFRVETNPALRALGLDAVVGDGLVVRQIIRGPLLNGYEIESLVTRLDTDPVAPALLAIPVDYSEIPAPQR
jgi:hypothetical protein